MRDSRPDNVIYEYKDPGDKLPDRKETCRLEFRLSTGQKLVICREHTTGRLEIFEEAGAKRRMLLTCTDVDLFGQLLQGLFPTAAVEDGMVIIRRPMEVSPNVK